MHKTYHFTHNTHHKFTNAHQRKLFFFFFYELKCFTCPGWRQLVDLWDDCVIIVFYVRAQNQSLTMEECVKNYGIIIFYCFTAVVLSSTKQAAAAFTLLRWGQYWLRNQCTDAACCNQDKKTPEENTAALMFKDVFLEKNKTKQRQKYWHPDVWVSFFF